MLIPFTVDPDIFSTPTVNLDCLKRHEDLIRLWGLIGQLVIPADKESESKLLVAINKSPEKVRVRWVNAFKNYRKRCCAPLFGDALSADIALEDESVCDGVRLASLDETRGVLWGLGDEQFSKLVARSLEICRFGHEDTTDVVKHALALASRPIAANESTDVVWRQRFRDLATVSRVVTVVDRYAIKNFLLARNPEISGLERLILNLAGLGTPGKKVVNIYSAYSSAWKLCGAECSFYSACQQIFKQVENFCKPLIGKNIFEVNIHIAVDQSFGSVAHYRYVLFDDKNLIQLDTGLEALSGNAVKRTCVVKLVRWYSEEANDFKDNEKKLRNVLAHSQKIVCQS